MGDVPVSIGRSHHNDVQIKDLAISRRHLEIIRREGKYFIKDLKSKNGTFVNGKRIRPGLECEIRKAASIVIGMSVISLGEQCLEHVLPFLEAIGVSEGLSENSGLFRQHGTMTTQKIMELFYKVPEILTKELDLDFILDQLLNCIFEFLGSVDRAVIILIDPKTKAFQKVKTRMKESSSSERPTAYNVDVIDTVISRGQGILFPDPDAKSTEEEESFEETLKLSNIESVICVPIIIDSQIRGIIYMDSLEEPYGFRKQDFTLFEDLAGLAALSIDSALLFHP
ncbi:MAG: FHA domain-containing protein [Deltaproteobacteria bacterium]|nr:FHA domain-containing protein [Deltaproteobacteria bacterium]